MKYGGSVKLFTIDSKWANKSWEEDLTKASDKYEIQQKVPTTLWPHTLYFNWTDNAKTLSIC